MLRTIVLLVALQFAFLHSFSQQVPLKRGMKITRSVTILKNEYALNAYDSLNQAVVVIEGDNITVDFNKAVLRGSIQKHNPDEFFGVAVLIQGGKNITIKNLTAKGYKVALLARNVEGLKLENCDFSYNYRQHLNSTQEKEDISDWLSHHHNENDEWLRYGSAIYLRGCTNAVVANCKVTGGQNALMMTECNNGMIYNNDFSFNSGLGLGMYKSSNNQVLYNRMNFNVRGYSHGVYNRGQDSAGILIYEQSNDNTFYKNAVTHGGDGFFLWAGQTTMDTGKEGCNGNKIWNNDFSYAPTNGIEVTFSSNSIIGNRVVECDHGIWGGYSFNTIIRDNEFASNRIAIAIEHGLHNQIISNHFSGNKEALRLWARKEQPADWAYARYRDTRSAGYVIASNRFNKDSIVYNITRTDSILLFDNLYEGYKILYKSDSTVTHIDSSSKTLVEEALYYPTVQNPIDPFTDNSNLAGRKNIRITEWGPYNFHYPIIWNTNPTDTSGLMSFDVLGPKGQWRILSVKGVEGGSKQQDTFPSSITFLKEREKTTDIEIVAEYTGPAFVDAMGNPVPANKPYRFSFKKFFQPIDFQVRWYGFDSTTNPIKTGSVATVTAPFKTERVNKLDYAWWGGIKAGEKQYTQFLTIAEGKADVPKGTYELAVTWDDAVRVYVDGKRVIDEWVPSKYLFDESPHKSVRLTLGGTHTFRVEHVELGGFATLSVKLKKS